MTITLGIRELTRNTSKAVHRAAAGENIIVTEHDQPIAMLVPLPNTGNPELDRMIQAGELIPASTPGGVAALLAIEPIDTGSGIDLAAAMSADREG